MKRTGTEKIEHLSDRQIQEELRRTENEIARSLRTIRERLSKEHLTERAVHKVIRALVVRLDHIAYLIRRHPAPALMGGILLICLALRKRRSANCGEGGIGQNFRKRRQFL